MLKGLFVEFCKRTKEYDILIYGCSIYNPFLSRFLMNEFGYFWMDQRKFKSSLSLIPYTAYAFSLCLIVYINHFSSLSPLFLVCLK